MFRVSYTWLKNELKQKIRINLHSIWYKLSWTLDYILFKLSRVKLLIKLLPMVAQKHMQDLKISSGYLNLNYKSTVLVRGISQ